MIPVHIGPMAFLAEAEGVGHLIRLHAVDFAIIAIYFAAVLAIGFYLKNYATTGEDFFVAGRKMTAWAPMAGAFSHRRAGR